MYLFLRLLNGKDGIVKKGNVYEHTLFEFAYFSGLDVILTRYKSVVTRKITQQLQCDRNYFSMFY